jgi:DNA repair exonuclease SbcCD nuclease subunit
MSIKILATADLHLGRKSSAVPEDSEEGSTKYTWKRIVDWSIQNNVNILVLSGDIIDQDNRYFEAIGPLQSGFDKLNKNGIAVYLVTGNHDFEVLAEIIQTDRYENVYLLGRGGNWEKKIYEGKDGTIQFVGWSFPKKHFRENPLKGFKQLETDPSEVTIGLLHSEADTPDSKYGPVEINELKNTTLDAWILGHIHKPSKLNKEKPFIAYPGSPHALSSGEQGVHGPLLLEIEGKNNLRVSQIPLSPTRYENLPVEINPTDDETTLRETLTSAIFQRSQELLPELEKTSYLVFDIEMKGNSTSVEELDKWTANAIQDYQQELETGTKIIIRKITNMVQPAVEDLEELARETSPAGKLAESIIALKKGENTPFVDNLLQEWKKRQQKVNKTGTFHPLQNEGLLPQPNDQTAREYILKECNQLLNTLINQRKQQN